MPSSVQVLAKGANAPVSSTRTKLVLRWDGPIGVDIQALLCGESGKVRSDQDFVFFNQPEHPSGAVRLAGKADGAATTDSLEIFLPEVEPEIQKILVTASADGGNFGQLLSLQVTVTDPVTDAPAIQFDIESATTETALIVGEVYRRQGQWKFRAVGQGYANGLQGLATDFGITVDDEPISAPPMLAPPSSVAPQRAARNLVAPARSEIESARTEPSREPSPAYVRPERAARGLTAPARSDSVAESTPTATHAPQPRPAASAVPVERPPSSIQPGATPQFAPQQRKPQKTVTTPGLQTAAAALNGLVPQWQHNADTALRAGQQMMAGVVGSHPDMTDYLRDMASANNQLLQAYQTRFGSPAPSAYNLSAVAVNTWITSARSVTTRLQNDPVPWTDKRRKELRIEFDQLSRDLLGSYDPTLRQFALDSWQQMRTEGVRYAGSVVADYARTARPAVLPPPPIGPPTSATNSQHTDVPGPGPLNIYLGQCVAESMRFTSTSFGNHQHATDQVPLPGISIPLVIDLDSVGAFVIDERRCIEGAVLNLLSALPANQLQLKIFDPEHGGNSAKFLFGLGDAAERVIGDRVKTSDRELNDLLQSTEEHITFVTQRFLQGEHKSLTEYNTAAGEVAEPYRLLVLYDFPSGFSRAGHLDEDQIDRVVKIIRNGPRTGVFTILVVGDIEGPEPSRVGELQTGALGFGEIMQSKRERFATVPIPKVTEDLPVFITQGALSEVTREVLGRGPVAMRLPEYASAPDAVRTVADVSGGLINWRFAPARPPDDATVSSRLDAVKRSMHSAQDVQVTPERVAQLADQAQQDSATTLRAKFNPTVAYPDQPETWWHASSQTGVVAHFGRIGARQVADLLIDSEVNTYGALIGGRPGSGKSVLIHAIVMSIVTEYSPSEVELYLIDFKEGVEFKQYADIGLPHAKVIAIESERDFGLSVLQRAAAEIKHRGDLFRGAGQGAANLDQYRTRTGQPLKRLVLIIDEFQQLFYRDDKIAAEAAEILELILRQGRAFGIHVLLASQSLAGMASLGKHVLGLIPTRIALQSNENDSRMILGEENADAQTLVRAGEGILNRKGGHKDANERFQAAFWDADTRTAVLQQVMNRAQAEGHPNITTIFAGHEPADVTTVDPALLTARDNAGTGLQIPVGLPLTLDPAPLIALLRRESGSNLLMVDERGHGALAIAVAAMAKQGITVDLCDFVGEDEQWAALVATLEADSGIAVHGRRAVRGALTDFAELVNERQSEGAHKAPARVLVIAGMGRARDFDPGDYDEESPSNVLGTILRDGPEIGVHVVCWFDRPAGINKRLSSQQQTEFGQLLVTQMTRDDSSSLIDSDSAAGLKPGQGILANVDRASEAKVRTFAVPEAAWLARFAREA